MMDYLPLIVASVSFSLFSMLHCAAMCGPFKSSLVKGQYSGLLYHIGRFISYLSLALTIKTVAIKPLLKIIDKYDHIVLILFTIIFFVSFIMIFIKLHRKHASRINMKFLFMFREIKVLQMKAFLVGLLTGALPCGVLYAFLLSVSMIDKTEVIVLNTLLYTIITGIGVDLSSFVINLMTRHFRFKKIYILIPMYSISLFILLYRFIYSSFTGVCFS